MNFLAELDVLHRAIRDALIDLLEIMLPVDEALLEKLGRVYGILYCAVQSVRGSEPEVFSDVSSEYVRGADDDAIWVLIANADHAVD